MEYALYKKTSQKNRFIESNNNQQAPQRSQNSATSSGGASSTSSTSSTSTTTFIRTAAGGGGSSNTSIVVTPRRRTVIERGGTGRSLSNHSHRQATVCTIAKEDGTVSYVTLGICNLCRQKAQLLQQQQQQQATSSSVSGGGTNTSTSSSSSSSKNERETGSKRDLYKKNTDIASGSSSMEKLNTGETNTTNTNGRNVLLQNGIGASSTSSTSSTSTTTHHLLHHNNSNNNNVTTRYGNGVDATHGGSVLTAASASALRKRPSARSGVVQGGLSTNGVSSVCYTVCSQCGARITNEDVHKKHVLACQKHYQCSHQNCKSSFDAKWKLTRHEKSCPLPQRLPPAPSHAAAAETASVLVNGKMRIPTDQHDHQHHHDQQQQNHFVNHDKKLRRKRKRDESDATTTIIHNDNTSITATISGSGGDAHNESDHYANVVARRSRSNKSSFGREQQQEEEEDGDMSDGQSRKRFKLPEAHAERDKQLLEHKQEQEEEKDVVMKESVVDDANTDVGVRANGDVKLEIKTERDYGGCGGTTAPPPTCAHYTNIKKEKGTCVFLDDEDEDIKWDPFCCIEIDPVRPAAVNADVSDSKEHPTKVAADVSKDDVTASVTVDDVDIADVDIKIEGASAGSSSNSSSTTATSTGIIKRGYGGYEDYDLYIRREPSAAAAARWRTRNVVIKTEPGLGDEQDQVKIKIEPQQQSLSSLQLPHIKQEHEHEQQNTEMDLVYIKQEIKQEKMDDDDDDIEMQDYQHYYHSPPALLESEPSSSPPPEPEFLAPQPTRTNGRYHYDNHDDIREQEGCAYKASIRCAIKALDFDRQSLGDSLCASYAKNWPENSNPPIYVASLYNKKKRLAMMWDNDSVTMYDEGDDATDGGIRISSNKNNKNNKTRVSYQQHTQQQQQSFYTLADFCSQSDLDLHLSADAAADAANASCSSTSGVFNSLCGAQCSGPPSCSCSCCCILKVDARDVHSCSSSSSQHSSSSSQSINSSSNSNKSAAVSRTSSTTSSDSNYSLALTSTSSPIPTSEEEQEDSSSSSWTEDFC